MCAEIQCMYQERLSNATLTVEVHYRGEHLCKQEWPTQEYPNLPGRSVIPGYCLEGIITKKACRHTLLMVFFSENTLASNKFPVVFSDV